MKVRGVIDWAVSHFKAVLAVLLGASIIMFAATICIFYFGDPSPTKTLLDLNIAPLSSAITLDGNSIQQGTSEVEPGTHHLAFSADGFNSKEYDIEVKANQTNSVSDYLTNNENGFEYYLFHASDMEVLMTVKDEDVKEFVENYKHAYTIFSKLPMEHSFYTDNGLGKVTIKDGRSSHRCKKYLCLEVSSIADTLTEAKSGVMEALHNSGYSITDYEVVYDF